MSLGLTLIVKWKLEMPCFFGGCLVIRKKQKHGVDEAKLHQTYVTVNQITYLHAWTFEYHIHPEFSVALCTNKTNSIGRFKHTKTNESWKTQVIWKEPHFCSAWGAWAWSLWFCLVSQVTLKEEGNKRCPNELQKKHLKGRLDKQQVLFIFYSSESSALVTPIFSAGPLVLMLFVDGVCHVKNNLP